MDDSIFQVGAEGARLTVYGAVDEKTTAYLALAIFVAVVAALFLYKRVM